jgi:hypothetical protein
MLEGLHHFDLQCVTHVVKDAELRHNQGGGSIPRLRSGGLFSVMSSATLKLPLYALALSRGR